MNEVDNLLKSDFFSMKFEDQMKIVKMGPHQPRNFECEQTDKLQKRCFSSMWFDKIEWLSVSLSRKTFFCFYCLLFGGDSPWSKAGYYDLKHLSERTKKHEKSIVHINNAVKFKTFGVQKQSLNINVNVSIHGHNKIVRKNRHILNRIINYIKFCGYKGLPICAFNNTQNHSLGGNFFVDLVSLLTNMDNTLDGQTRNEIIQKQISKSILDELLDSIYHVYKQKLKEDIENTNFLSLQVDEITGTTRQVQLAILVRFIKNDSVVERFISLRDISDLNISKLANLLIAELRLYGVKRLKLVAQSYNTSIMIDNTLKGIQTYVEACYPQAKFIHSYTHEFTVILKRICSGIPSIKNFFVNVSGFASFFSKSSRQLKLLETERAKHRPDDDTNWNFQQKIVSNIYECQVEILACLENIPSDPAWDDFSIRESLRLSFLLNDDEFFFFLDFFYNVLQHVELLYGSLQTSATEDGGRSKAYQEFEAEMGAIKDNIGIFENVEDDEPPSKRKRDSNEEPEFKMAAMNAWNRISAHVKNLFQMTYYVQAFSLVNPKFFKQFKQVFPEDLVNILSANNIFLDNGKLVNELSVLYANETFAVATSVGDLLKLLINSDLAGTFTQVAKIAEIALTTPVTTDDSEHCFDTMGRIGSFLESTKSQEKLNALTVLKIHQDVVEGISDFNNIVMDHFASEKRRTEYLYK